ncbi:hypothetical protein StoSoilB13_01230 [Arthrobacter sp. StoSoilB13]|nr:hypothetical protein StoSoilB13_01230 [Arthrobacter sp. StoSoilB13]
MDGTSQVHGLRRSAAIYSCSQFPGGGTRPGIGVQSRFKGSGEPFGDLGDQERQWWAVLGDFRRPAGQAIPPKCRQRIHIPFRLQGFSGTITRGAPGADRRINEAVRADVEALILLTYDAGHAKVCHKGLPLCRKQHVARGNIPVGRSLGMQVSQDLGNRGQNRHDFSDSKLAPAAHQIRKGTSCGKVHDQANAARTHAGQLHDVVKADKVLMLEPGQDPALTEAMFGIWSRRTTGTASDAFDGESGAVLVPAGKPDCRRATAAQWA